MGINKKKEKSDIVKTLEGKSKEVRHGNFKISLEHFDSSQRNGSSFKDWEKTGLLSHALNVLKGYCNRPLQEQIDGDKFGMYGSFPKQGYTNFSHPEIVPPDAKWAKIHVNGKSVLVGHIVNETFYLVFLDKFHNFYLTKFKRAKKDGGL